jgi:hypothetical protein
MGVATLELAIWGMPMSLVNTCLRRGALLTALTVGMALGGCGAGGSGVDLDIDAPVLNAVGLNLSAKPKNEEDLPERPGLVMPPSSAAAGALPPPGERSAATQNWPVDPDQEKKKKAEVDKAAKEKYCREGDWSGKAGIGEFEKNVGREARCPSKLGEALSKSIGGGEAKR